MSKFSGRYCESTVQELVGPKNDGLGPVTVGSPLNAGKTTNIIDVN